MRFAARVGELAAQHGLTLISGNARGADTVAQESCLRAGGCVISVVADSLLRQRPRERVLYLSELGYDLPFTSQRALSRNRLIHSMAQATFVAQCSNGTGGTWDGTCRNLRGGWSPVYCLPDGRRCQTISNGRSAGKDSRIAADIPKNSGRIWQDCQ